LAGPTALGLILTTVALILMTRAAPQLNVFSVGYPFRVLMGMVLLIWLLPQFGVAIVQYLSQIMERWKGML
jgi:flagellar biosynthetic protein FliR